MTEEFVSRIQFRIVFWRCLLRIGAGTQTNLVISLSTSTQKPDYYLGLSYGNVLMTNEMHNYYDQFFIPQFLSAQHVSNESSRS